MAARRPLVRVGGRDQQLPAGDTLDLPELSEFEFSYRRTSLLELLDDAQHSDNLGSFPTGVNEISIVYLDGYYHLFYDDLNSTRYCSATTLEGLSSADSVQLVVGERYPAAYFELGVWHLFTNTQSTEPIQKHYRAALPEGPYSLVGEMVGLPMYVSDIDVQRNPLDGYYYAAYKMMNEAGLPVGVARATSIYGPWVQLGTVFDNRAAWHAQEEADGACAFIGGRSYVLFAGWDGYVQRPGIVEVDPVSMKALGHAFSLVEPLEDWQLPISGRARLFNPVLVKDPNPKVVYTVNAHSGPAGWGFIMPRITRLPRDKPACMVFGLDMPSMLDAATGIPVTAHGAFSSLPDRQIFTSETGGFYGNTAFSELLDFTLVAVVQPAAPTSNGYQRICSFEIATSVGNTLGLWINDSGCAYVEVQGASSDPANFTAAATQVMTAGQVYKLVVRRQGGKIRVFQNGALILSGDSRSVPRELSGYRVANNRNTDNSPGQQFQGVLYRLELHNEALPQRQW